MFLFDSGDLDESTSPIHNHPECQVVPMVIPTNVRRTRCGTWRFAVALMLGWAGLAGCGDSGGTGPTAITIGALQGSWGVETWQYVRAGDPAVAVDWVAQYGLTGGLTIQPDGAFAVSPALPGGFGQDFGNLTADGDSLFWDGENDEEWVHASLAGPVLTLDWPEVELVDMDRDGTPEDVRLRVVLRR
jgi:hypothetical protein